MKKIILLVATFFTISFVQASEKPTVEQVLEQYQPLFSQMNGYKLSDVRYCDLDTCEMYQKRDRGLEECIVVIFKNSSYYSMAKTIFPQKPLVLEDTPVCFGMIRAGGGFTVHN